MKNLLGKKTGPVSGLAYRRLPAEPTPPAAHTLKYTFLSIWSQHCPKAAPGACETQLISSYLQRFVPHNIIQCRSCKIGIRTAQQGLWTLGRPEQTAGTWG
jgi:hypothetical protein